MSFLRWNSRIAVKRNILRLKVPPAAIYAIGDIHGCLDLYDDLENQIVNDGRSIAGPKLIVCLGDTIDRGPSSAATIDRLAGPAPRSFQRLVLRGNHEEMMLEFLKVPERHLDWIDFGGAETLASYGLSPNSEQGFRAEAKLLKRKLDLGISASHRSFLSNLPIALEVRNLRFSHAGYSLGKPAKEQVPEILLWGPPQQSDGHAGPEVLVHGHVPVDEIEVTKNRINLDLGAYQTGRLAAMRFLASGAKAKVFIAEKPWAATRSIKLEDK